MRNQNNNKSNISLFFSLQRLQKQAPIRSLVKLPTWYGANWLNGLDLEPRLKTGILASKDVFSQDLEPRLKTGSQRTSLAKLRSLKRVGKNEKSRGNNAEAQQRKINFLGRKIHNFFL
jgi:hypothetical protein